MIDEPKKNIDPNRMYSKCLEYFNCTIEAYFQIASESILKTEIPWKNVNIDLNYRLFIHRSRNRAYENVYHDRIIKCIIW